MAASQSVLIPADLSPAAALEVSQKAPIVLENATRLSSSMVGSLLSTPETAKTWIRYENLLFSCLRTGDKTSAQQCLDALSQRFGDYNERVMALKGLVKEATADGPGELQHIAKEYDQVLSGDATNIPIAKRRIALLRSMRKIPEAVTALIQLLDFTPTDGEAWSELSDIYLSQGLYRQAIYALEEVVVIVPNAWNIHARLGEIQYMAATASGPVEGPPLRYLAEAVKRFCRSIELCDDYLRGHYGLKLVTKHLLVQMVSDKRPDAEDFAVPDTDTLERLERLATEKLAEIVRRYTAQEPRWKGYDEAEIAAARRLLSGEMSTTVR